MSRALDDLTPEMRPLAVELLARCAEAGVAVMIIDTLRTVAQQEANIRNGVSWTIHSKHLPQEPSGKSNAIDLAPYEQYLLAGPDKLRWKADDPVWFRIGAIGESIGLEWGGRWAQKDMGHFELASRPKERTATV